MILFADDTNIFYSHKDSTDFLNTVVNTELELNKLSSWFQANRHSILDQNLNWKSDIHIVARKISKSLGIIYKASFCLNEASLRTLYFNLVYPYLCYCVGVWGSTYPSNLKKVVTLQKRAIRIISKSKFHAHTDPLFKELKMLKLDSVVRFHICIVNINYDICKFMFLYRHGLLPESFDNMFPLDFHLTMKFIAIIHIILSRDLAFLCPVL